jgi:predicted CoA-substrate-specific enzyme activase
MKYVAGIDIGSGSTKAVILDEKKNIVGHATAKTTAKFSIAVSQVMEEALNEAGLHNDAIGYVATTGLGRYSVPHRDIQITDITCAARGARFLFPGVQCVLDIGAQSTRAIKLRDTGRVHQFRTNDRCAAGSGGFLERAARYLEVPIDQVGDLSLNAKQPQAISSICAVLGESEIINHVSNGATVPDILRGIHDSLADRATGLLKRVGLEGQLAFVGGVARQEGMIRALQAKVETPVVTGPGPEYVCALGAALLGLQRYQKMKNIEKLKETIQ